MLLKSGESYSLLPCNLSRIKAIYSLFLKRIQNGQDFLSDRLKIQRRIAVARFSNDDTIDFI